MFFKHFFAQSLAYSRIASTALIRQDLKKKIFLIFPFFLLIFFSPKMSQQQVSESLERIKTHEEIYFWRNTHFCSLHTLSFLTICILLRRVSDEQERAVSEMEE